MNESKCVSESEKSECEKIGEEEMPNNDYYEAISPITDKLNNDYGRTEALYTSTLLDKKYRNHFITIPQSQQNLDELNTSLKTTSKTLIYSLIAEEQHEDGNIHFHINLAYSNPVMIKAIHKRIINTAGNIKGSINYQSTKNPTATINYIKKNGKYIEEGTPPKSAGQPRSNVSHQEQINSDLSEILNNDTTTEVEKLQTILDKQPAYYIINKDKIKNVIQDGILKEKNRFTYHIRTNENTTLNAWQSELWSLISEQPKARRIIWVYGDVNTGKSFMFNYIQDNFKYELYSAGQSASLDNVIYGYDGEGVIAWDLPKNFNFGNEELVNSLTSVIEKFSDFGQILTSKKYSGKKQRVLGHTLVFSNREPLEQLQHRDLVIIKTSSNKPKYIHKKTPQGKDVYQVESGNKTNYFYTKKELDKFLDSDIESESD